MFAMLSYNRPIDILISQKDSLFKTLKKRLQFKINLYFNKNFNKPVSGNSIVNSQASNCKNVAAWMFLPQGGRYYVK